ncbi:hypothetical protein ACLD0W_11850 [Alloalcanivorax sp. C16-1]|uniref:hypothetical protein n=1 Tax=Alloalcanivorax sp. C16-1 TaxID=3390051 RepID=UPI003970F784
MRGKFFKIFKMLGFVEIIKIPGKSFDDLSPYEIGLMIDAFVYDEDKYFDPMALGEFLNYKINNDKVRIIRDEIKSGIYRFSADAGRTHWDENFLKEISESLKSRSDDS